jgi:hypothetical protein
MLRKHRYMRRARTRKEVPIKYAADEEMPVYMPR